MNDAEQREAARQFVNKWRGRGREDEDGRSYWIDLLSNVLGMENVTDRVEFEKKVIVDGNTKRIDVYIPETHVLIEQKSLGKALDQKITNSGSVELTPYEQAKRYNDNLPYEEKARWIITSNFSDIWIYDMNEKVPVPTKISLDEIPGKYPLFDILVRKDVKKLSREMEVSIAAGEIVGLIYDAFSKQYADANSEHAMKSLNVLCVRLVFCLYAEDAGIFGHRSMFHDYLEEFDARQERKALIELFRILDTKPEERDPYLADDNPRLAAFPYVNGGLFADENIEIPPITDEIRTLLLEKASSDFDWSEISPTIFGAVFESTLNPETRRSGGMHYTSIENIHKVIDPLFLDDLMAEYNEICTISIAKTKERKLREFQNKLSQLTFLDPACGSGNFLTETYLSLRRLENRILKALQGEQISFGDEDISPIKVSINQFYGIEINDFAATVAKTALWIAESQMMKETEDILFMHLEFLPLKTNANIIEGNALRIDWEDVVSKDKLSYIMGNPPFVGTKMMNKNQKVDAQNVLGKIKKYGVLDYVACWYKLACDYIANTNIKCALVSTNSICQGEQVNVLWSYIIENGCHIDFAYRPFIWDSEANIKAHVHCVIVGFSSSKSIEKRIYTGKNYKKASNINGYLIDAPDVFIDNRKTPISDVPLMYNGCKFLDDGNYVFTQEEKDDFIKKDPHALPFIRPYLGAQNFINGEPLYCIWLKNADPSMIKKSSSVMNRIAKVKEFRLSCNSPDTQKYAERPMLPTRLAYYSEDRNSDVLLVPIVSSERRRYIPIGYINKNTIVSYSCMVIPDASLYTFGLMNSNIHNAWMRVVCGRLKSDFRYSNTMVYNNFPFPTPTEEQKAQIEQTAQMILNARALYPNSTLADLYDPLTMPPELRKAHQDNDRAVMQAYGFNIKDMSEADCVAALMEMYKEKIK